MHVQSIGEKLNLIGFGSINAVLDGIKNSTILSLPVAKQERDNLIAKRKKVDGGITDCIAAQRELTKRQNPMTARVAQLTSTMASILSDDDPTNDAAAKPKMAEKLVLEHQLADIKAQLDKQAMIRGTLEEAIQVIDSLIEERNTRIQELESTQHQTAAQEEASAAIEAAKDVIGSSSDQLDSSLAKAQTRQTRAQVDLERKLDELRSATNNAAGSDAVDDALADFKANLKKPATAAA